MQLVFAFFNDKLKKNTFKYFLIIENKHENNNSPNICATFYRTIRYVKIIT